MFKTPEDRGRAEGVLLAGAQGGSWSAAGPALIVGRLDTLIDVVERLAGLQADVLDALDQIAATLDEPAEDAEVTA